MLPFIFGLLSGPALAVSIYVGPVTSEDGFVSGDKGVADSILDLKARFGQTVLNRKATVSYRLAPRESDADIRLNIVTRGVYAGDGGTSVNVPGQLLKFGHGYTYQMPGMSFYSASTVNALSSVLRFGEHQQPIVVSCEIWKQCAELVVNQVTGWLVANRERIATKE